MSDPLSLRYCYTFGPHEPSATISSGSEICIECPDSDNRFSDGSLLRDDQCQAGQGLFKGNPVAGPLFVEGAEPGDAINVEILEIALDREDGQTGLAPGHGLLPAHLLCPATGGSAAPTEIPRHLYRWRIDVRQNVAELLNPLGQKPVRVPLNPFVGCIGVCPKWGQSTSTLFAGSFGGNMDLPALRAGATIELPVWRRGALLMMGDIHAAQGHGEIIGGAIETSGRVRCRVHLQKKRAIPSPRIRDGQRLIAVASDGDLRVAVQSAYAHLLDWLVEEFRFDRFDAYNLISQTAEIMMGNLVCSPFTVAAVMPRQIL